MFKLLPTKAELAAHPITKEDLGKTLYTSFDTALPQLWVDAAAYIGRDVRPEFVWSYDPLPKPSGPNIFGVPGPLTHEAAKWYEEQKENLTNRIRTQL